MNFSTVPPWCSSSARTRVWYRDSTLRTSSGSRRSAWAVKPTRSMKTIVTVFRSSPPVGSAPASAAPQALQNRESWGFSRLELGHVTMR